jgi:hypothetical protein
MQIYVKSELKFKNLNTKYVHKIHTYLPDLCKLNRNFIHSLFAECVINRPRLYLCVLNGQYVMQIMI